MQAIILAGGLGTRLRSVLKDVPKPMAPIHGKPFLAYLLSYLKHQGFQHIILSVHYLHEQIEAYFKDEYQGLTLSYAIEEELLGTGGAILNASQQIKNETPYFVLNGDTFVKLNYANMFSYHQTHDRNISIALCQIADCNRYGQVQFDQELNITAISERGKKQSGWINAGVYLINKPLLKTALLPKQFSFEKDFLLNHLDIIKPKAFISNDYFIDIGIPEDYARAHQEFK